jgi:uncharacterized membrane protein YoaT (DUF817 family)
LQRKAVVFRRQDAGCCRGDWRGLGTVLHLLIDKDDAQQWGTFMQSPLRKAGSEPPAEPWSDPAPAPHDHSAARNWAPLARFIAVEARVGAWAERRGATLFLYELTRFGIKQAWACLFGALMLALLIGTHFAYPRGAWLARYDFLVIAAVAIQAVMLACKLETWEEAKVIFLFHVVGTAMEVFKTAVGSWLYPEPSLLRLAGVPLFTGFMYAAIGSYIARCWRLFDFRFTRHPPLWAMGLLAAGIYVNFFAHHFAPDMRLALFALAALLVGPCWVHFKVWRVHRRMPLLMGFGLVASFIWLAENIGTFTAAWVYPHQRQAWEPVSLGKLGAWLLLMIISYVLVALVSRPQAMPVPSTGKADPPRQPYRLSYGGQ